MWFAGKQKVDEKLVDKFRRWSKKAEPRQNGPPTTVEVICKPPEMPKPLEIEHCRCVQTWFAIACPGMMSCRVFDVCVLCPTSILMTCNRPDIMIVNETFANAT